MPRYRLLQARLLDDPVRLGERRSFAERLGRSVERVALDAHPWVREHIDGLGAE